MKKIIVNLENVENPIWINANEIEEIIEIDSKEFKMIEGNEIDMKLVDRINEYLDKHDRNLNESSLEDFFYENKLENVFELVDSEGIFKHDFDILYDYNGKCEICSLSDYESKEIIRVWVNNEWKNCYVENKSKEFETDDLEFINIDQYDGNNWYTGQRNCHSKITRLGENEYLILEWSEFMADPFTTALEVNEKELDEYLEKYDRLHYFNTLTNLKYGGKNEKLGDKNI